MDKEKLEQKVSQLLNVSEEESGFTFQIFKEKIVNMLNVGEAIKIDDLGVFQLKEQMSEKYRTLGKKKKTLVYSPSSDLKEKDSLFLTLNIDSESEDSTEFSEKVFQVGVNRPMITLHVNESEEDSNDRKSQIIKKINDLISGSEKITNFDLWEDYLQSKESKSMLEDEEKETDIDSLLEEDKKDKTQRIYENDFEELNEEEILNELMDHGNLDSEQLSDITTEHHDEEEVEPEEIIEPEESSELTEMDFETMEDQEVNEIIKDQLTEDIKENNFEDLKLEDENFGNVESSEEVLEEKKIESDDLDEKISEDAESISNQNEITEQKEVESDISEIENSEIEDYEQENIIDELDSKLVLNEELEFEGNENKNTVDEENGNEEIDVNESEDLLKNELVESEKIEQSLPASKSRAKKRNFRITLLIALFIMVIAVGIYYLFFQNPTWLHDKYEIEVAQQKKYENKLATLKGEAKQNNNDQIKKEEVAEPVSKTTNHKDEGTNSSQKIEKTGTKINNSTVTSTSKTQLSTSSNIKTIPKKMSTNIKEIVMVDSDPHETEVSKNIYFNGRTYSLQVSSWKNQIYAEREAEKLLSKGYSAFIVKAYIKKFDGIWHRVRVGPYPTLEKVKSIQSKLK